jgi:hypothetical protein
MAADGAEAAGGNASGELRYCLRTATVVAAEPSQPEADRVAGEVVKVPDGKEELEGVSNCPPEPSCTH